MGEFLSILFVILWVVFVSMFRTGKLKGKANSQTSSSHNINGVASHKPKQFDLYKQKSGTKTLVKHHKKVPTDIDRSLFEDRDNDWLAKQLREEAAVMRRGDFLDLGARHEMNCDAEALKMMHATQHSKNE